MDCLKFKQQNLKVLPNKPGIYQMLDQEQQVIYVGKAKNLKKRIVSYLRPTDDAKTKALIQQVDTIKIIITATENEALLLENTLIKRLKPKYNILFKDDKSFPFLLLTKHEFPRLILQRKQQKEAGDYFGPYSSSQAARNVLNILQKCFKLRNCNEIFFRHRTRPCIQYQIDRCSAPCVGFINSEQYREGVDLVKNFLGGKSKTIIKKMQRKMRAASLRLDYEQAAQLRDQVDSLQKIYRQQYVCYKKGDVDVCVVVAKETIVCIQLLFVRDGQIIASRNYLRNNKDTQKLNVLLAAFLVQFYLNFAREFSTPSTIIVNQELIEKDWIASALSEKLGKKIIIAKPHLGIKSRWMKMAEENAMQALNAYFVDRDKFANAFTAMQQLFILEKIPEKIACFDVSHTSGEATIGSCVVFNKEGPVKNEWRRFNITNIRKGDDYAAIEQMLIKKYKNNSVEDLLIIDGGKGQLNRAIKTMQGKKVAIIAIAKGVARKPGFETIYASTLAHAITLQDSIVLRTLQKIRDYAHDFAIRGHRNKRAKQSISSILESIPGVGPKRRKILLQHFAGMQKLKQATVEELASLPDISGKLAQVIYDFVQSLS